MNKIITIDGPAGSGKSTVARKLARKLGFIHLNSGVLYRALALEAINLGTALDDESALERLAGNLKFSFVLCENKETQTLVNGKEILHLLVEPKVSTAASKVALFSKVRDVFLEVQRSLANRASLVVEGRDAGTIVFPNASYKFYLDAELGVRAKRRFEELALKGEAQDLELVQDQMEKRDQQDSSREVAPSICAEDAIAVDTSFSSVDQVVDRIVNIINNGEIVRKK